MPLDSIDHRLLQLLQANAKVTNAQLAQEVGLSPAATLERVRRLENQGIIAGYHTHLAPHHVGQKVRLLAHITLQPLDKASTAALLKALDKLPAVVGIHRISGPAHFLVELLAPDLPGGDALLQESLGALPMVSSLATTVVLHTHKAWAPVPLSKPNTR